MSEDEDDEEANVARARASMCQRHTLAWHGLKPVIPAKCYVKVLRKVTEEMSGEVTFIRMPNDMTVPQIDTAVKSWT